MEQQPSPPRLRPGQGCAIAGLFLAGFAIFVAPLVVGPTGVALGVFAEIKGERRGRWVAALAALGTVLGLLIGLLPDKFVMN